MECRGATGQGVCRGSLPPMCYDGYPRIGIVGFGQSSRRKIGELGERGARPTRVVSPGWGENQSRWTECPLGDARCRGRASTSSSSFGGCRASFGGCRGCRLIIMQSSRGAWSGRRGTRRIERFRRCGALGPRTWQGDSVCQRVSGNSEKSLIGG
jgi:hypothetical protein